MKYIGIKITAHFIRDFRRLEKRLSDEIEQKIEQLKNRDNHEMLRVHKLHGKMKGYYSFSVNYQYRIVFTYTSKDVATLITIGDHSIYE